MGRFIKMSGKGSGNPNYLGFSDLIDTDRSGEGRGLARASDRVQSPKAVTNQPLSPYEELQIQRDLAAKQKVEAEESQLNDENDETIEFEENQQPPGLCFQCLAAAICFPIKLFIASTRCCCRIKHVNGYEEAVIFRNGKKRDKIAPSGYFCVLPCCDTFNKVDMRTVMFEIPEQYLCTKDAINICIDGLVYYRVVNANDFIQSTADPAVYAKKLTQVALRRAIMTRTVDQIFNSDERDEIEEEMQDYLNKHVEKWGLEIERVYVKDLLLPENIQRSIEELNEKTRLEDVNLQIQEKQAATKAQIRVTLAEAEVKASKDLVAAADQFKKNETALQLRYLETLNTISDKNHSSIVFPLQYDLMKAFHNS